MVTAADFMTYLIRFSELRGPSATLWVSYSYSGFLPAVGRGVRLVYTSIVTGGRYACQTPHPRRHCAGRSLAGAAGGAVIAGTTGDNVVTGIVIGGAGGYFRRNLNVPGHRNRGARASQMKMSY